MPVRIARSRWAALALIVALALGLRALQFGNPVAQVDDQFYRLVGERMWQGALPFVDIWDRKPVGLFLLYAAMVRLPGSDVLATQLCATLAAIVTALVLKRIANRIAGPVGGLFAALAYLAFLGLFGGDAGQSPVFYNLPVALAAMLVQRIVAAPGLAPGDRWRAAAAMALMGLAIQIKYTALFEGAFFGAALLRHVRRREAPLRVGRDALLWGALGVAPTLLAWLFYALRGQGDTWVFANISSIFLRTGDPCSEVGKRVWKEGIRLLPLLIAAGLGWRALRREPQRDPATFARGWLVAAAAGWLVFGTWYDHYLLPVLAPLAVVAAPALAGSRGWRAVLSIALVAYAAIGSIDTIRRNQRGRDDGTQLEAMAKFIAPRLSGCLFVYDGEVALYSATHSCLPTRWPFPDHLNNLHEEGAVGVSALAETRRIMAAAPAVVVTSAWPQVTENRQTWTLMQSELAAHYRLGGRWPVGGRARMIYLRADGARSRTAAAD